MVTDVRGGMVARDIVVTVLLLSCDAVLEERKARRSNQRGSRATQAQTIDAAPGESTRERARTSCSCCVSLVNSLSSRIIWDGSSSDSVLLGKNDVVELEYRAAAKLDITIGKGPSEQALSCTCCALWGAYDHGDHPCRSCFRDTSRSCV